MLPSYGVYTNFHLLVPPQAHQNPLPARSQRSAKTSSRKGSTDIDSKTKFKTEVCRYWVNNMECPFGENCNFAHGDEEMRARERLPSKYKTRGCHKFQEEGYCPYGARCQFIHRGHGAKRVGRGEVLRCLGAESEKFFAFLQEREKNSGKTQRLPVFEGLGENNGWCGYSIAIREVVREGDALEVENYVDIRSRHNSF